ncbi:MAG TPA: type I restriction enzyme HsdR N-terminal domain-containing protein, partial [Gemmatimonadota bacterium]|nr:type I restriction enzyme HsdR N-terminal domain-containing protein [Gemmatimonadota bacterium]
MAVPKKVVQRLSAGIKQFRPILEQAKARDINEADTVQVVAGLLVDVFGWHPFFEVTKEYAVRSTFVDLAVKSDQGVAYLIEVKAIGADLRENHLRQAVNYAANQGIDWVVLTNGQIWRAYKVLFNKPISEELVFEVDLLSASPKDPAVQDRLFVLTKEGMTKSAIAQFHEEQLAMSKYNVAAVLRSPDVGRIVRREIRRAFPNCSPSQEEILAIIEGDVLKREVTEGPKADEARKRMERASRPLRKGRKPR